MTDRTILNLNLIQWRAVHGDLELFGTWFWDEENGFHRPCIAIMRAGKLGKLQQRPYILPLESAWVCSEEIGDPAEAAAMSVRIMEWLDMGKPTPMRSMAAIMAIRDHLGDLVAMPVRPEDDQRVVADAFHTDRRTGETIEAEILDSDV